MSRHSLNSFDKVASVPHAIVCVFTFGAVVPKTIDTRDCSCNAKM